MAKKKTIDLREPTPVPAGDVNIIYNGTRIGGFSEDTEAVLKTAGCRVEHDISVNYTKPSGGLALNTVNVTYNVTTPAIITVSDGSIVGENTLIDSINITGTGTTSFKVACKAMIDGRYFLTAEIPADSDIYIVTCNNQPISYSGLVYHYTVISENQDSVITGQTYNITIMNKEKN